MQQNHGREARYEIRAFRAFRARSEAFAASSFVSLVAFFKKRLQIACWQLQVTNMANRRKLKPAMPQHRS